MSELLEKITQQKEGVASDQEVEDLSGVKGTRGLRFHSFHSASVGVAGEAKALRRGCEPLARNGTLKVFVTVKGQRRKSDNLLLLTILLFPVVFKHS